MARMINTTTSMATKARAIYDQSKVMKKLSPAAKAYTPSVVKMM